jgi:hypothetical protein
VAEPNKQAKKDYKKELDELRIEFDELKKLVDGWIKGNHDDRYFEHEFISRFDGK